MHSLSTVANFFSHINQFEHSERTSVAQIIIREHTHTHVHNANRTAVGNKTYNRADGRSSVAGLTPDSDVRDFNGAYRYRVVLTDVVMTVCT